MFGAAVPYTAADPEIDAGQKLRPDALLDPDVPPEALGQPAPDSLAALVRQGRGGLHDNMEDTLPLLPLADKSLVERRKKFKAIFLNQKADQIQQRDGRVQPAEQIARDGRPRGFGQARIGEDRGQIRRVPQGFTPAVERGGGPPEILGRRLGQPARVPAGRRAGSARGPPPYFSVPQSTAPASPRPGRMYPRELRR